MSSLCTHGFHESQVPTYVSLYRQKKTNFGNSALLKKIGVTAVQRRKKKRKKFNFKDKWTEFCNHAFIRLMWRGNVVFTRLTNIGVLCVILLDSTVFTWRGSVVGVVHCNCVNAHLKKRKLILVVLGSRWGTFLKSVVGESAQGYPIHYSTLGFTLYTMHYSVGYTIV